jgi:hypothetical protein
MQEILADIGYAGKRHIHFTLELVVYVRFERRKEIPEHGLLHKIVFELKHFFAAGELLPQPFVANKMNTEMGELRP